MSGHIEWSKKKWIVANWFGFVGPIQYSSTNCRRNSNAQFAFPIVGCGRRPDPHLERNGCGPEECSPRKPEDAAPERKAASEKVHRLLIHVDQNDPAVINLALNNATNVVEYYRSKGQNVAVDVVTYGPGLHMLRADTSPVQDRIRQMKDFAFPSTVQFSACNNTKEGMEKKEGHPVSILPDAVLVPSGVVHLMEMQEKGWAYIRP